MLGGGGLRRDVGRWEVGGGREDEEVVEERREGKKKDREWKEMRGFVIVL